MASRNPDFATLSEAAYEAADRLIDHVNLCNDCTPQLGCDAFDSMAGEYDTKKSAALKALRAPKTRGKA
jgi:hypothetical protein